MVLPRKDANLFELDHQILGVDLLALAPHRFYGPKGVGVLYKNRRARVEKLLHGGMQENEFRAGTENVAAIAGSGVAAEHAKAALAQGAAHATKLQVRLLKSIRQAVEGVHLNGRTDKQLISITPERG